MATQKPELDFKSPEDLDRLLDYISRRLHYINRVSGESHYMWNLAELIRATGHLASLIDDKTVTADFGDGWSPGPLDDTARTDRILEMLRGRLDRP